MFFRRPSTSFKAHLSPRVYLCPQCCHRILRQQHRNISQTFLSKVAEAKEQWSQRAEEINAGRRESMLSILESRGLLHDVIGERKDLDTLLTAKRVGVYCGVDPTAPSLHVGHLIPFMVVFWMYLHGYHALTLIGGGTARIGDPTGRLADRPQMSSTERKANIVSIHYQLKKLWGNVESVGARHGYKWEKYWHRELTNNGVWWNKVPFVDVLKYMGSGVRIGTLLNKETVKKKMESGDGMSFAEFCYPVMQAWDWWYMYSTKGIQLQVGGCDQYGNILAGADAVKHVAKTHTDPVIQDKNLTTKMDEPMGLTTPLLTTASGEKFGKSAGNAIWLDQNMTSLFDLYAFLLSTADADVERYLKMFTLLPLNAIENLMRKHADDRSKRIPQRALAAEFIELVHGKANVEKAQQQYEEKSEQRRFVSLSSLISSNEATAPTDGAIPQPTVSPVTGQRSEDESVSTSPFTEPLELDPKNPLSHNQNPAVRERARYTSRHLNPFAPLPDPNKPSQGAMRVTLPVSLIKGQPIARALHSAGLVTSRSEGHRITTTGGAYIGRRSSNQEQMSDDLTFYPAKVADPSQTWDNVIRDDQETGAMDKEGEEGLLVLRVGKWKVRVVRIVTDELFEALKLPDPPGWSEFKSALIARKAHGLYEKNAEDSETSDTTFVEPAKNISRKDHETERRKQRKEATKYFEHEAVRQRLSDSWNGRMPLRRRRARQADASDVGTEQGSTPSGPQTGVRQRSPHLQSLLRSPRAKPEMTERKLSGVMHEKRRMLYDRHQEGSARVMEMMKTEQKSQRIAESDQMDRMREAEQGSDKSPQLSRGRG